MTFSINGLRPEIQPIVARYLEQTLSSILRYDKLVQFARDEGEAFRTRLEASRRDLRPKDVSQPKRAGAVYFLQTELASFLEGKDQPLMLETKWEHLPGSSIPTDELPLTEHSQEGEYPAESLMYAEMDKPALLA